MFGAAVGLTLTALPVAVRADVRAASVRQVTNVKSATTRPPKIHFVFLLCEAIGIRFRIPGALLLDIFSSWPRRFRVPAGSFGAYPPSSPLVPYDCPW